jgi:hypothetical protein
VCCGSLIRIPTRILNIPNQSNDPEALLTEGVCFIHEATVIHNHRTACHGKRLFPAVNPVVGFPHKLSPKICSVPLQERSKRRLFELFDGSLVQRGRIRAVSPKRVLLDHIIKHVSTVLFDRIGKGKSLMPAMLNKGVGNRCLSNAIRPDKSEVTHITLLCDAADKTYCNHTGGCNKEKKEHENKL